MLEGMFDLGQAVEIGIKIALAAVLGGMVGAERERSGKWAGLRTHMLIAVGAALLTHLSVHVGPLFEEGNAAWDPGRIAAQIVSGVGFIGAGTIIQSRGGVRGLTTAAGLWVAAAVGMAVGARFYSEAVITTVVLLLILAALQPLAGLLKPDHRQMLVGLPPGRPLSDLAEVMEDCGVETREMRIQEVEGHRSVTLRFKASEERRQSFVAALHDAGIEVEEDEG